MKHIVRMAALLAYAAAVSLPLTASAQSSAPALSAPRGHCHQDLFMRALHSLTLTDAQETQIRGFISAARRANRNATPEQCKANMALLHQQITSVLRPEQIQQLNAFLVTSGG